MASDGLEVLEKTAELVPDVAIFDLSMPNTDGLAAAIRIMAQDTPTAIVLVSAYDDLAFIRLVEAVANGQAVLHKTIIQRLMDIYHKPSDAQVTQLTDPEEKS